MEKLWKKTKRPYLVLILNTLFWMVCGLLVWGILQFFVFKSLMWAICFAGYPAFFIGFVGGVFFLWKKI